LGSQTSTPGFNHPDKGEARRKELLGQILERSDPFSEPALAVCVIVAPFVAPYTG
jgi:hypothetical protein